MIDLRFVVVVRNTAPDVRLDAMRWRLLWALLTRRNIEIRVGREVEERRWSEIA